MLTRSADGVVHNFPDDTDPAAVDFAMHNYATNHPIGPQSNPPDSFFTNTSVGRILDAFGQGAAQNWGSGPLEFTKETDEALKESGLYGDLQKPDFNVGRAFNVAVLRRSAAALDILLRGTSAAFGGTQAAIAQTGTELGAPRLGRDVAAFPEALGVPAVGPVLERLGALSRITARAPKLVEDAAAFRAIGPEAMEPTGRPDPALEQYHSKARQLELNLGDERPSATAQIELPDVAVTSKRAPALKPKPAAEDGAKPAEPKPADRAPLIDEEGRPNLPAIRTPEDVEHVVTATIGPRSDIAPELARAELADAAGIPREEIAGRDLGASEELIAKRQLVDQSSQAMHEAAVEVVKNPGNEGAINTYLEAISRHDLITESVAKEAKVAREELPPQQSVELAHATAAMQTPAQVAKLVKDSKKPWFFNFSSLRTSSFGDMVHEFVVNNLLSGIHTHVTYEIGQGMMAAIRSAETGIAGQIGRLHGGEKVQPGEFGAGIWAIGKGAQDALPAAWGALRTGVTPRLPGETAANFAFEPTRHLPGPLGVFRAPTHMTAGIHTATRSVIYAQNLAELAYRRAVELGYSPKDSRFPGIVDRLTASPTQEMMEEATGLTNKISLMTKGGPVVQSITNVANHTPGLRWVVPFTQMSGNAIREGVIERTLIGPFLSREVRRNLLGRNGNIARDLQITRMITGATATTALGFLVMHKLANGAQPFNPNEADIWRQEGNEPYSFRVGDFWVSMARMGTPGQLFGSIADLVTAGAHMADGDIAKAGSAIVQGMSHLFIDESGLRGISDLFEAIQDPKRYGSRYIGGHLASYFTPFSTEMRALAHAIDPYQREARGVLDSFLSIIPFGSKSLLPVRDRWGEPIPSREALGGAALTAIYLSRVKNDPVNLKLQELNGPFPAPVKDTINGVKLTRAQHDDYARVAGRLAKMELDRLVADPRFNTRPIFAQQEVIRKVIESNQEKVRGMIMMQNPSIKQAALAERRAEVVGAPPVRPAQQR